MATADFALEHGFELAQLSLDFSRFFPENLSESRRREIREYYHSKDIGLCLHGPSDIPLMNRHQAIREAGINRILEMIDLASDLGGRHFIFHPGRLAFYSMGKSKVIFVENRIPGKHVEYFKSSLAKILDYNAGRLTICIENTHDLPPSFLEAMTMLAEDQGLRFAWDIGYTDILAQDSRARMLKFYSDNSSFVKIFHLHDINESGGHKALGTGRINVSAYMEIINTIKADVILEIFPEKSLLDSINYINGLAPKLKTTP
jgi:sugar phosphate isomerase/epimerase